MKFSCEYLFTSSGIRKQTYTMLLYLYIMKTCLCNIQEIFSAVKIKKKNHQKCFANFLIFDQYIDCGYMLEPHVEPLQFFFFLQINSENSHVARFPSITKNLLPAVHKRNLQVLDIPKFCMSKNIFITPPQSNHVS